MDRASCVALLNKIAKPVLSSLAERTLHIQFPSEGKPFACIEAFARTLLGVSAFVEGNVEEASSLAALALEAIDAATDPSSPDYMPFATPHQSLVEAGLISLALLHAPTSLWAKLPARVQHNVHNALSLTRSIPLRENNWVLFGCIVEAFMLKNNFPINEKRLNIGLERMQKWYLGDGTYGDGPNLHCDYYNSFIIHPMLNMILTVLMSNPKYSGNAQLQLFQQQEQKRLTRYVEIQERMIAPDGTFVALGRSLTYRCGAFHALAHASLKRMLPSNIPPQQAKLALTRTIKRTLLGSPSVFCEHGFLMIGLSGQQPKLAENYINRGSVYMCCVAFLPLGLSAQDPFWQETIDNESVKTSWEKAWSGEDCLDRDKTLGYSGKSPFVNM